MTRVKITYQGADHPVQLESGPTVTVFDLKSAFVLNSIRIPSGMGLSLPTALTDSGYASEVVPDPAPIPPTPEELESVRVSGIMGRADDLIAKYVAYASWTDANDKLHLRQDRVIKQHAQIIAMMSGAADWASFKTAMDGVNGTGKTMWQRIADSSTLANNTYANLQPIKDWMDAVRSNAVAAMADDQLPENWERFEQGSGDPDAWLPAWTNTLNRFSGA